MPNRHPVDQLADVRAEIKVLREHEEKLRSEVLATGEMVGDEHEAVLTETITERIDLPLLKREMGLRFLQPFLRKQTATQVRLKPRTQPKKKRST